MCGAWRLQARLRSAGSGWSARRRSLFAADPMLLVGLAVLVERASARNWYWASSMSRASDRCDQLPVAGVTMAMGKVMQQDVQPRLDHVASADAIELEASSVPVGDWFAIASSGTLQGGAERCDGRFVYASVPSDGRIKLTWRPSGSGGPPSARVVFVHGNGYGQTYLRTADISPPSPISPPLPPSPTNMGSPHSTTAVSFGTALLVVGVALGVIVLISVVVFLALRRRWPCIRCHASSQQTLVRAVEAQEEDGPTP